MWQGTDVTDEELLEYISESSTMSKAMDEYEGELLICPQKNFEHKPSNYDYLYAFTWGPFVGSKGLRRLCSCS